MNASPPAGSRWPLVMLVLGWGGLGCNERPVDDDPIPAEVRAYARYRCQRVEECECPNITQDRAECEARVVTVYQQEVEGREGIELSCFAAGAELWRTASCDDPPGDVPCSVLAPLGGEGSACAFKPFADVYVQTYPCAEGLICFEDQCVMPVHDGQPGDPCTPDGRCRIELTCVAGLCVEHPGEGEPCDISWNCEPQRDLYCAEGTCAPRKESGSSCTIDEECKLGTPCTDNRCTPVLPGLCQSAEDV